MFDPEQSTQTEDLKLNKDIIRLGKTGNSPWIYYYHGIGSLNQFCKVTDYAEKTDGWQSPESKLIKDNPPLVLSFSEIPREKGKFYFSIRPPSEYGSKTSDKKVFHAEGFQISPDIINNLSRTTGELIPGSQLTVFKKERESDNYANDDYNMVLSVDDRQILLRLFASYQSQNPDVYHISLFMDFDENQSFATQQAALIDYSTKLIQTLTADKPTDFRINPNAAERFLEMTEEKIAKQKRKQPIDEKIYYQTEENVGSIFSHMHPPYETQINDLNKQRITLLDSPSAEPKFTGVDFPSIDIAGYDFSCQPYLNESESITTTQALYRALSDESITLDEPVVRIHYTELYAPEIKGQTQYELLTANPKRVIPGGADAMSQTDIYNLRTSIGSTHQHIWDTCSSRRQAGAVYPFQGQEWHEFMADPRGIILETLSGKKYAVWEINRALALVYSGGSEDLPPIKEQFDPILLSDMESKYGIKVLHGNSGEKFLEQTIMQNMIDMAAINWFEKHRHATTHDLLRTRILMKSKISPDP